MRELDLADLTSVKRFVADWHGPLHILVNNAGVVAPPELIRTREGVPSPISDGMWQAGPVTHSEET